MDLDPYNVPQHWLDHTPLADRTREDYDAEVRDWIGLLPPVVPL